MFGGQLGVVRLPVVLIGLSVLAAGDDGDGDDDDCTDAAKRHIHSHTRVIATDTSKYISQLYGIAAAQNSIGNYEDDPVVMCMA